MKYEKAQNILPYNIIELIQKYTDGGYIYIPRKNENKNHGEKILRLKDILVQEIKKFLISIHLECPLKF